MTDARKALESALTKRIDWHKCSCPEPCDDYGVFPGGCAGRYRQDYQDLLALAAIDAALASGEQGWGQFARAICESEGRDWLALDNPREDCERWIKAGQACAAIAAPPAPETRT